MRIRQLLANRWSNWDRGARKWSLQCCQLISPLNLCLDITALDLFFSFSIHFQYVWLRLFCRLLRSALLSISTFHLWGNFLLNPIICLHRSASYLDLKERHAEGISAQEKRLLEVECAGNFSLEGGICRVSISLKGAASPQHLSRTAQDIADYSHSVLHILDKSKHHLD